jgi:hypothetical protein
VSENLRQLSSDDHLYQYPKLRCKFLKKRVKKETTVLDSGSPTFIHKAKHVTRKPTFHTQDRNYASCWGRSLWQVTSQKKWFILTRPPEFIPYDTFKVKIIGKKSRNYFDSGAAVKILDDFLVIWSGTRTQKCNWIAYPPYLRNALILTRVKLFWLESK